MFVGDIRIWNAAQRLLEIHGSQAAWIAEQRADDLLEDGDFEGYSVWTLIASAISEWGQIAPAAGERCH